MYLKRLELQGFKSFADKVTISFGKNINGVVGPNFTIFFKEYQGIKHHKN